MANVNIKVDTSGLTALANKLNKKHSVDVGWIDTQAHWKGDGVFTTAALASNLHYWSKWGKDSGDSFMIDEDKALKIKTFVS